MFSSYKGILCKKILELRNQLNFTFSRLSKRLLSQFNLRWREGPDDRQ